MDFLLIHPCEFDMLCHLNVSWRWNVIVWFCIWLLPRKTWIVLGTLGRFWMVCRLIKPITHVLCGNINMDAAPSEFYDIYYPFTGNSFDVNAHKTYMILYIAWSGDWMQPDISSLTILYIAKPGHKIQRRGLPWSLQSLLQ